MRESPPASPQSKLKGRSLQSENKLARFRCIQASQQLEVKYARALDLRTPYTPLCIDESNIPRTQTDAPQKDIVPFQPRFRFSGGEVKCMLTKSFLMWFSWSIITRPRPNRPIQDGEVVVVVLQDLGFGRAWWSDICVSAINANLLTLVFAVWSTALTTNRRA
ncbi:hypothetical protein PAAG_07226 [Paracoccidioides lutzii Pb01]|uniref:Uncharacterized protein n=1 Tax=Paracoccidioides lutzii (strain ATCC MYA-826 / Pb01) TaxID=502779 RepID=C1H8Y5_PARBA|nr:hypothetical protein PAAG_07226 [Paracoccidioides lutzii Pb01]EEH36808.2 hypothetical protein PAAG_07226 [Paracoccidioides lutzii Pb01]